MAGTAGVGYTGWATVYTRCGPGVCATAHNYCFKLDSAKVGAPIDLPDESHKELMATLPYALVAKLIHYTSNWDVPVKT